MKVVLYGVGGLFLVATLVLVWYARDPSTQLVDASGNALTAGAAAEEDEGLCDGPLFAEARALIEERDFASARTALVAILEESKRDGEACILLCEVTRRLGEAEEAVDYGLKAIELLPEEAEAHLVYAKALGTRLAMGERSLAALLGAAKNLRLFVAESERVVELNPEDTEARSMLALYHAMAPAPLGDLEQAKDVCREIEALDPVGGKRLLAFCHHHDGETELALELCREGLAQYPEELGFRVTMADIYGDTERFDEAEAEYEAARQGEKDETYYRAVYYQARMHVRNELDPARALELLEEYIAADPQFEDLPTAAHAFWRRGLAFEQLGRVAEAREAYEEALRRDPRETTAAQALAALDG